MEKPVIISIRGVQSPFPGEEDVMELVTQGTLRATEENEFALTYRESELTGLEGTTTTFRILKDRITLQREGTLNSEMIFQEGRRHVSMYQTPFGGFALGVRTHSTRTEFGRTGGDLEIHYALDVENEHIGENSFLIHVAEPSSSAPEQITTT